MENYMYKKFVYIQGEDDDFVRSTCDVADIKFFFIDNIDIILTYLLCQER